MTGTVLNVATVLLGGTVGALVGERLPNRFRETAMHALGLMTLLIGFQMALGTQSAIVVLGAVVAGGLLGEMAGIDDGLKVLGDWVESKAPAGRGSWARGRSEGKTGRRGDGNEPEPTTQDPVQATGTHPAAPGTPAPGTGAIPAEAVPGRGESRFSRGFVTAGLLFCVGPMTILGSFQDGLTGVYSTLAVKSMLDGFAALALASSLGWGVVASSAVVLVYQGALTLGAGWARPLLSESVIREMTAAGGLLIVGIGLNLLGITRIRVANMLPALVIAPLLVALPATR